MRVLQSGIRVGCTLFGAYLILQSGTRVGFNSKIGWFQCVSHACMPIECVSPTLAFHVLLAFS